MKRTNASGTFLQGYINVSYINLLQAFGDPNMDDPTGSYGDGKVTVEWCFETEDGVVFTIYDWKCPSKRNHEEECFHIGGYNLQAVQAVKDQLDKAMCYYH